MACPYFYPTERRRAANARSAMLPLGDVWSGRCEADGGAAPPEAALQPLCFLGYARGTCPRFPATHRGADAIRFAITRDDGVCLSVSYVMERDHHPLSHGCLEYSLPAGHFADPPSPGVFERQAEAYVESYLGRKKEASVH